LERLDSDEALSEVHIHYKSLMTIVHEHVGCKENCKNFTVALKMLDVFNMKQMYDSLITRKENSSEDWNL